MRAFNKVKKYNCGLKLVFKAYNILMSKQSPYLNTSTFRHTSLFSRADRFKQRIDAPTDFKYDVSSKVTRRSTSFGIGPRPSTSQTISPSPNRYNVAEFPNKKITTTLGQGRDRAHFRSMTYQIKKKAQLPSPDTYQHVIEQNHGKSFSLRIKLPGETERQVKKRVPGPGQYAQVEINSQGKYYTSKIRNIRSINFGVPQKGYNKRQPNVGPGQYDVVNTDSVFSEYKMRAMRRNTTRNFGTGRRNPVQQSCKQFIPGPGRYQVYSSFGGGFVPPIN